MSYKEFLVKWNYQDSMDAYIWYLNHFDKAYQRLRSVKSKQQYILRTYRLRFINNAWM